MYYLGAMVRLSRFRPGFRLLSSSLLLSLLFVSQPLGASEPSPAPADHERLTGRQIYDKVLANRFHSFEQRARLVSGDRAGNEQESRMWVAWQSFRDEAGEPARGVLSKSLIRYTHPFDLRFSAYLIINNHERPDDQFVYLPSRRRVSRVNLRGEPVLGSDFSFEDVVPRELEEASYERLPDEEFDGRPCYRVDVVPDEATDSEYSRFRVWVEFERFVVLRSLYWDRAGVELKELLSPAAEVRDFDGIYVAMKTDMKHLQLGSYSRLTIDELEPNAQIPRKNFDPARLESH